MEQGERPKKSISRREFLKRLGYLSGGSILASWIVSCKGVTAPDIPGPSTSTLYVSKNGTPVTNMQKVIDLAGGIEKYIAQNDFVILKPNLQWPCQGYTHTPRLQKR